MKRKRNVLKKNISKALASLAISAFLAVIVLGMPVSAATVIDLTQPGSTGTDNGAVFIQGRVLGASGSGVFDSFVRISSNNPVEQGYNTNFRPVQFDETTSFDKALILSNVPAVNYQGTQYRIFDLDINQKNSEPLLSLDRLKIYLSNSPTLHNYDFAADTFDSVLIAPIFNLGDAYVKLDYSLESGSGASDMVLLVPESSFGNDPNCAYGGSGCSTYVYVYSLFGQNFPNNDGYEEWNTRIQPFVRASKTATATYDRAFSWNIEKSVDIPTFDLFTGESGTSKYTVSVVRTVTDSNFGAAGTITIVNPPTLPDGTKTADAVISQPIDSVDGVAATVSCGVIFPYTLKSGSTLTCTYTAGLSDKTNKLNTASVDVINIQGFGSATFTATANVIFGDPTTVTGFPTVSVTDTNGGGSPWSFSDTGSQTYPKTFTCDADQGKHDNTATITETGQSASASVTVNCYQPKVTKTADASFTREFTWTIDKSVDKDTWNMFTGDSGTSKYTVAVTRTSEDKAILVSGTITVENPNPSEAMTVPVTDKLSDGTVAVVDCGGGSTTLTVSALGSGTCSYKASPPTPTDGINTATVTLNAKDYTGTKAFTFVMTEINPTISVTDTNGGGSPWTFSDTGSQTYTKTFTCDADQGKHDNTATITETGQSASASVTVNCYAPTVTKDAKTTFTRTWHWTIDKSADQTELTLAKGQQFTVNYDVALSATSTDSDWAVSGNINVHNPAPIPATITGVADVVTGSGAAIVNCGVSFPYTLAAGGTLSCTYSSPLPDASDRTNTGTATLQNTPSGTTDFSGTAAVKFSATPTTEIDKSVSISDTLQGDLGTADAPGKTITYPRTIGPYDICGDQTVPNTASFVTVDTGATGSDSWNVLVHVPCVGCTLTIGYWKTHAGLGPQPDMVTKNLPIWLGTEGGAKSIQVTTAAQAVDLLSFKGSNGVFDASNGINKLYAQLLGAKLNIKEGADGSAVASTIADSDAFLATHDSLDWASLSKADKNTVLSWVNTLDKYNTGLIGPGHCSEEKIAIPA